MNKIIGNAAFSIFLFFGSVYMWFVADAFPKFPRYKNIDSDFWPKLLLVMIATVSLLLLYQQLASLMAYKKAARNTETASTLQAQDDGVDRKKLLMAGALVVLYFVGLQTIGFVIATFVFLTLGIRLLNYGNKVVRAIYPAVFTILISLLFIKGMSLPLPRGTGVFETFSRFFY